MDAGIDDGDSLHQSFCPDLLIDHIVAKVLAPKMYDELLILVHEFVRRQHNNKHKFNRK